MALIKCKECSKEISDTANTCPHCGSENNIKEASLGLKILCFFIPLIGLIIFATNISQKPKFAKQCLITSIISIALIVLFSVTIVILNTPTNGTFYK